LLCTEALRAAQRQPAARLQQMHHLLQRIPLMDVDRALFRQAGLLGPSTMRSLDAVHIGAAMSLGPDLGVILTYDQRMTMAATLFGLPVASPT
jgi:hypothetical protein